MVYEDIVVKRIEDICEDTSLDSTEKARQLKDECEFLFSRSDDFRKKVMNCIDGFDPDMFPRVEPYRTNEALNLIRKEIVKDIQEYGEPKKVYTVDGIQVDVVYETDDGSETITIFY